MSDRFDPGHQKAKIRSLVAILILCAMILVCLPVRAWDPDGRTLADLPLSIQAALPGEMIYVEGYGEEDTVVVMLDDGDGTRRIYIFRKEGDNYQLDCKSVPLPLADGCPALVEYHGEYNGEDRLRLIYGKGEYYYYFFLRLGDGVWRLSKAWAHDIVTFDPTFGLVLGKNGDMHYSCLPGKTPEYDLASLDPTALPIILEAAIAGTDTEGWAVVKSSVPTDRLNLRAKPAKSADSLGRYYSGTPVRVRSVDGDWAEVDILGIKGYMMTEFLAFGLEMLEVRCWFPWVVPWGADAKDVRFYQKPEAKDGLFVGDLADDPSVVYILADVGNGWYHAVCSNGLAGYVQSKHFEDIDHLPWGGF
ncbi:MAG: SH3 domain-containing protein [Firmicutes bacterium]|nr:SH3 domain-containing protein [Bacillota bacterium]